MMTEAELVVETIEVLKRDGWNSGYLHADEGDNTVVVGSHCILGAIGRARWGKKWDLDCHCLFDDEPLYRRLWRDPVTRPLIEKLMVAIQTMDKNYVDATTDEPYDIVYDWNDKQKSPEPVIELLEKVQAEIG